MDFIWELYRIHKEDADAQNGNAHYANTSVVRRCFRARPPLKVDSSLPKPEGLAHQSRRSATVDPGCRLDTTS